MNLSIENIVDTKNCYLADVILSPAKINAEKAKSIVAKTAQSKKVAVLGEIENKLRAAENRRKSLIQEKLEKIGPITARIEQVQQHQLDQLSNTRQALRQQIEEKTKKHEENYAKIMLKKAELAKRMSDPTSKIEKVQQNLLNKQGNISQQIENKFKMQEENYAKILQEKVQWAKTMSGLPGRVISKIEQVQQHQLNKLSNTSQQIENKIKKHEENYAKIMLEKVELAKKMSGKNTCNFRISDHQKIAEAKMAEIKNKLAEAEKKRTSLMQEKLELVKNKENKYLEHKKENIANSKRRQKRLQMAQKYKIISNCFYPGVSNWDELLG